MSEQPEAPSSRPEIRPDARSEGRRSDGSRPEGARRERAASNDSQRHGQRSDSQRSDGQTAMVSNDGGRAAIPTTPWRTIAKNNRRGWRSCRAWRSWSRVSPPAASHREPTPPKRSVAGPDRVRRVGRPKVRHRRHSPAKRVAPTSRTQRSPERRPEQPCSAQRASGPAQIPSLRGPAQRTSGPASQQATRSSR